MQQILFFLSLVPFFLLTLLLLTRKLNIIVSTLLVSLFTSFLAFIAWQIFPIYFLASILKSIFIALDIFLIIFGATYFWQILQKSKVVESMHFHLRTLSADIRLQVILLAWFLGSLIEGTAGFGTPAAIIAPILVTLGIRPVLAVALPLIGNSTAVAFGAVGTPIRIGFSAMSPVNVAPFAGIINIVGLLVPLFILLTLKQIAKNKDSFVRDALPFSIVSGLAFVIPYAIASMVGKEFPSIIGALVGLIAVVLFIKAGLFIPKTIEEIKTSNKLQDRIGLAKVLLPYVLLILLLFIGKSLAVSRTIFLAEGITHTINFFNPGIVFVLAVFLFTLLTRGRVAQMVWTFTPSFKKAIKPFLVIFFISFIAQLMINSGHNASGEASMINFISEKIKNPLFPLLVPFVGAFGSFIAGSATVSNIIFGSVVNDTGIALSMNSGALLALQLVGAGVGNMIAISNIVAAEALVGLHGEERSILKKTILPCLFYLLMVGLIGIVIVNFLK